MSSTTKASVILIVLLVAGALMQRWMSPDPPPVIPPAVVESHAIDSAAVRDSIERARLRDSLAAALEHKTAAEHEARRLRREADSLRAVQQLVLADTATADSTRAWRDAYYLARAEADTLRRESAAKDQQLLYLAAALTWTQLERDQLAARLEASDRVRRQLATQLAAADPPCRIPLLVTDVRCPSRTETAVVVGVASFGDDIVRAIADLIKP